MAPRLAATLTCPTVLPVGSNFLVVVTEPRDRLTGNAAALDSVAVAILDALGESVAAYVGEANEGRYVVCVPYGAPLTAGESYHVDVTITATIDAELLQTRWRLPRVADYVEHVA